MKRSTISMAVASVVSLLVFYGGQTVTADHPSGPAGYWPFDDDTADDAAAHSNDGTLIGGASFSSDVPSTLSNVKSLSLDGINDYVTVPDSATLDLPSSLSVSAWVSLDANRFENNIVSKDIAASAFSNYNLHVFDNRVFFAFRFDASATLATVTMGTAGCDPGGCFIKGGSAFVDGTNPLGTWRHIAGVYDDTAKIMTVYLDGVKDGEASFTTTGSPSTNGEAVQIGKRKFGTASPTDGLIDEVQIYSRALSTDELEILAGTVDPLFVDYDGQVGFGSIDCDGVGIGAYTVIQDAVDAASSGDTISVCPSTYTENVDVTKDDLTIVSTGGPSVTTVDGIGTADEVFEVIADDVTIMGFEIKNGGSDGGIRFRGDDNVFAYNDIHDNSLYGIVAWDLGVPTSDRNVIRNNHIHDNFRSGVLIGANGNEGNVVTQNQVFDNDQGGGFVNIELVNNYQGSVTRNNVYSTSPIRSGILLFNWRDDVPVGENTVAQNNVHRADGAADGGHSFAGIEVLSWTSGGIVHGQPCDDAPQDENKIMRNSVHDNPGSGILLWSISDCDKPGDGAAVATVDNNMVERNSVHSNDAYGIRLIDADDNHIVFNRVHDNGLDGIRLQALLLLGGGSDRNDIDNNRVDTNERDGIRLDASSTDNTIQRNHMNGNVEHDAHDFSSGSKTVGTANTWDISGPQRNRCITSDPSELCAD